MAFKYSGKKKFRDSKTGRPASPNAGPKAAGSNADGALVVRCAPGLGPVVVSELKYRKLVHRKDKPLTLRQRNHDLLFLGRTEGFETAPRLHTAEEVHRCLLFGRFKISDSQLQRLAGALHGRKTPLKLVVTADGSHFSRQDLSRWLNKKLPEFGVRLAGEADDVLWVFCIDENYYVGLRAYDQASLEHRPRRVEERTGALPPTIAAALAFLGAPQASDTIFDPFCGSGTLLAETHALAPAAVFRGADLDRAAIDAARRNLAHLANLELTPGDGTATALPPDSVTLFVANLPFGKQYGDAATNPALYAAALAEMRRTGRAAKWRAVLLTSDTAALETALDAEPSVVCERRLRIKVRGEWAEIFVLRAK